MPVDWLNVIVRIKRIVPSYLHDLPCTDHRARSLTLADNLWPKPKAKERSNATPHRPHTLKRLPLYIESTGQCSQAQPELSKHHREHILLSVLLPQVHYTKAQTFTHGPV